MLHGIDQTLALMAAALLLFAGAHTVHAPAAVVSALRAQGVRVRDRSARALGVVQVISGAASLVGIRSAHYAVALMYLGFAAFVVRARRRATSCGCLGRADAPPTIVHAALDLALAIGAFRYARLDAIDTSFIATAVVIGLSCLGALLAARIISDAGLVVPRQS